MELMLTGAEGLVVCRRCRLADSPILRARGLIGRKALDADEGLYIATGSIHTFFMRFPIDVVFLDKENVVRSVAESVKPARILIRRGATGVVELRAGTCAQLNIRVGDRLAFVPPARGESSRAVRVAIASDDGRFLRVAGFLLDRHGFLVESCRGPAGLRALGNGHDVVVIDGSESLSAAARFVRQLATESPSTRVVVVSERVNGGASHPTLQALQIVPKWDSFERLVEAVSSAAPAGDRDDGR